jgi:hypothetical protein
MKKVLLTSSALLSVATVAQSAQASDGIKLDIGGFYRSAYVMSFDKDQAGAAGHGRTFDKLLDDSEIYFKGETTLDNGLTVGARVELEGETAGDQIDMSYVYFQGGFGKIVAGTVHDVLEETCVVAPGGTPNFSGYSPHGGGDNNPAASNFACTSADDHSVKVEYYSPVFAGFQFGVSYTPETGHDSQADGIAGYGQNHKGFGQAEHVTTAILNYTYAGDGWGAKASAGGSWEPQGVHGAGERGGDAYYGAAAFTFGQFAVGGTFNYFNNDGNDDDVWVAGGGVAYTFDAFTLGAQFSHAQYSGVNAGYNEPAGSNPAPEAGHRTNNRAVITGLYKMGPGILLDGDIGFSWYKDTDPATADVADDYHAFEVGIGSTFNF